MYRIILTFVFAVCLCSPVLAQVPTNSSTAKIKPGTYTSNGDGGYSYRQNGYSYSTDGKGNSRSSYGGVTTTTNNKGVTTTRMK